MNRKLIMGRTFEEAMLRNLEQQKISHREKVDWINQIPIIPNPLLLKSSQLELNLFTYKLAIIAKQERELTTTEKKSELLISRLFNQNELQFMNDIFAIEFTQEEITTFQELLIYNKMNPGILNGKRVWRVILLENIDDYEMRKQLSSLDLNPNMDIMNDLKNLKI